MSSRRPGVAPEAYRSEGVPEGKIYELKMADSRAPGLAGLRALQVAGLRMESVAGLIGIRMK